MKVGEIWDFHCNILYIKEVRKPFKNNDGTVSCEIVCIDLCNDCEVKMYYERSNNRWCAWPGVRRIV